MARTCRPGQRGDPREALYKAWEAANSDFVVDLLRIAETLRPAGRREMGITRPVGIVFQKLKRFRERSNSAQTIGLNRFCEMVIEACHQCSCLVFVRPRR